MGHPALHAERARFPLLPLLVFLVPVVVAAASLRYVQTRSLRPLRAELGALQKTVEAGTAENERLSKEVQRLGKEMAAVQGVTKVDIVWGGAAGGDKRVAFPYVRAAGSGVWNHPREGAATVWYYSDEGDTLARIAAHPRVLGATHLWPILARENGLKVDGNHPLPAGRLIRVPSRIYESQLRGAITEAGAPNEARDEIFAQAGLNAAAPKPPATPK